MKSKKNTSSRGQERADRPTSAEYQQRVIIIYKLLLASKSRLAIVEFSRTEWGLKRAATDNLIAEATKILREVTDVEKESAYALSVQQLQHMLCLALDSGDLKTSLAVRRELNELQRLKELPSSITLNTNNLILSTEDKELL